MANRTEYAVGTVHGTNPQFLIEKIVRNRIYEATYWKEHCFALDAEGITEKALGLTYFGGTFAGNVKPTDFLCLTLKMLQLQLDKEVIVEFIKNEDFRYLRALGAFYMRLTGDALDVYEYLEPLYNDGRRLRRKNVSGLFEWTHMDEFVDELLREEYMCNIALPRLPKRVIFEESGQLAPRKSVLEDELSDSEPETVPEPAEAERKSTRTHSGDVAERRGIKRSRDDERDIERDRRRLRSPSPRQSSGRRGDRKDWDRDDDRERRGDWRRDRGDDLARDRRRRDAGKNRDRDRTHDYDRDHRDRERDRHRDRDRGRDRDYREGDTDDRDRAEWDRNRLREKDRRYYDESMDRGREMYRSREDRGRRHDRDGSYDRDGGRLREHGSGRRDSSRRFSEAGDRPPHRDSRATEMREGGARDRHGTGRRARRSASRE